MDIDDVGDARLACDAPDLACVTFCE